MAISEQARHRIYTKLEPLLGSDDAATMIEHLSPRALEEVATKADLAELRAELRSELAEFRSEMSSEFADFRGEIYREIGTLRGELRTQTRSLFVSLVGLQITGAGVAIAVSRLV